MCIASDLTHLTIPNGYRAASSSHLCAALEERGPSISIHVVPNHISPPEQPILSNADVASAYP
jgi:hypothetical protein